jgi:hypothetical protein
VDAELGWAGGDWSRGVYELTPDTAPDAIRAGQRAAVAAALAALGPGATDAAVSDATDLPVWSVAQRRAELDNV